MGIVELMVEISEAPKQLTKLMKNIKINNKNAFKAVLRGFPEKQINTYNGDIGTVVLKNINFDDDYDQIPRPDSIDIILGMVCKGTKTEVHDKIIDLNLIILEKFLTEKDWKTLNGTVELASIQNHDIYIEQNKNTLLTTSIYEINCQLNYHDNNDSEDSFEYICNKDELKWEEND